MYSEIHACLQASIAYVFARCILVTQVPCQERIRNLDGMQHNLYYTLLPVQSRTDARNTCTFIPVCRKSIAYILYRWRPYFHIRP
ncbi:hypothetical protein M3J09_008323 [Ascochyta lentis]